MKKSKFWILLLLIIPCCFMFSACSFLEDDEKTPPKTYVTNISKTTETENTDTYLITYSDNTTSTITIENGKDGLNGKDLTLEELKKYCEENNTTLDDFIKEHLTVNYEGPFNSVSSATKKALKSTVSVWCEIPTTSKTGMGCGAGVIYKMEETYSYIVTNFHVVYDTSCITANNIASKIHVFTYGSQEGYYIKDSQIMYGYGAIECTYVGGAMNYDIAILRAKTEDIKKFQPSACPVTIASKYSVGDTAIAIGNPESIGTNVSSGIVSAYSENISLLSADATSTISHRVIRIDTPVNPGNSGGGLFNIEGNLIGIVVAKFATDDVENIGYAIPCDKVAKVSENLMYYHKQTGAVSQVKKITLGITIQETNNRSEFVETADGTEINLYNDALITNIENNSLGYTMGLRENDTVISATVIRDGQELSYTFKHSDEFVDLLLTIRAGDELRLKVVRNDITVTTTSQKITNDMLTIIK